MKDMTEKAIKEQLRILFEPENPYEVSVILKLHKAEQNPVGIVQLILKLTKELLNKQE